MAVIVRILVTKNLQLSKGLNMYLYILRHGTTKWNMEHLIQGQTDTELDEFGRLMASETAHGLKKAGIAFDRVYTSPLKRAYETARIVAPDTEITSDDRLKELSFGFMDGGKVEVMSADENCPFRYFKTAPDKYEEEVRKLGCGNDAPETLSNLCVRAKSFLQEVIEPMADSEERILISTHGALSKALLMHIRGESDLGKFWGEGLLSNCGFAVVKVGLKGGTTQYEVENPSKVFYDDSIKDKAPKLL